MKHLIIRWNPATKRWFCKKCGRTSDQAGVHDRHLELDQYECLVPSAEGLKAKPGVETETLRPSLFRHLLPGVILLAVGIGPLYVMEALKSLFGWEMDGPGMLWIMGITIPTLFLGCLSLMVGVVIFIGRPKQSKTDSP